jgi:type VI secretion system protein ImpE
MIMQAENYLQQGDLPQTLLELQNQIRKQPADPKLRIFLFQLLAVLGQWERALAQLKVLGELDASTLLMVQTYRTAIQCEALRAEVFAGKHTPLVFGDPQQWLALLVEALRLDAEGHIPQAMTLRNQALELAPAASGAIDGTDFAWIADADSRLGPVLEGIVNGRYYWIPFQQIRKIELEAPTDLRDVVWMPAQFTWINGGGASGLIPTRYPGAENSEDNRIRLARKTEWEEIAAGVSRGSGQRLLATDVQDYALLDTRSIQLYAALGTD